MGCFPWCVAFRLRTKIRPNVECVCSVGGDCSSSNVEIFVRAIRPAHRLAFPLLQTTVGFSPVPRLASVNAHRANGNLDAVPTVRDSPMVATAACVISSPCAARCAFGDCGRGRSFACMRGNTRARGAGRGYRPSCDIHAYGEKLVFWGA